MRIFMTGATGMVGSEILRALYGKHELELLVRGNWEEKVQRALGYPPLITDVSVINKSIEELPINSSSDYEIIIHIAGLPNLGKNSNHELWSANYFGTERLLSFAQRQKKLKLLVYMGTFYVPKNKDSAKNEYELTKLEAEKLIRKWGRDNNIPVLIVRPAIVIGRQNTGESIGCQTLCNYLGFLYKIITSRNPQKIILPGARETPINLVYSDWVAKHILSAMDKTLKDNRGHELNLHNKKGPLMPEILEVAMKVFDFQIEIGFGQPESKTDRALAKGLEAFRPYCESAYTGVPADLLSPPHPQITKSDLERHIRYYLLTKYAD